VISIGVLVAFTTLQTRLFFPIGSLLGVQLEVQSSLALFDRIFEYLDQPIDIVEGTRTLDHPKGDVSFDRVCFRYDEDAWTLKDVSFTVPAGTGGGADQMARVIQGVVAKNNLMKQSLVVINKAGGAGAEGFLDVKGAKGDPHKIIITLSNLFTTPLATGVPFNWKDLTPVAMPPEPRISTGTSEYSTRTCSSLPSSISSDEAGAVRSSSMQARVTSPAPQRNAVQPAL